MTFVQSALRQRPGPPFIILVGLLLALWIAGGASRANVSGQVVVRGVAWITIVAIILTGPRTAFHRSKAVLFFLVAALVLALAQLVPLPPGVWQMLPGRQLLADAATLSGQVQPWRPWSIVPSATGNAAASLVVPFATWLLVAGLPERDRAWLPGLVLLLVLASTLIGLLQFSGAVISSPLVNGTIGEVSGTFANRNHFALFIAMGCLLAPAWGFSGGRLHWRAPAAFGLMVLFLLTILASGSRAGLGLGVIALFLGLLLSRETMKKALSRYPRWVLPALIAGMLAIVAMFVLFSVLADRAVSINRMFAVDQGQDMRSRGLPTVLAMIRAYFPLGAGLGSFDPVFRMNEPYELLKLTYFNHAHNDFLELVLDTGVLGLLLLVGALGWWAWMSMRAWAPGSGRRYAIPRLGSAILFLVLIASIFDYPARTPMIMAIMVIAGMWLDGEPERPHA